MKNIIKKLGLDYKKIDVRPNDCVLFWKGKIGLDKCPTCDALRWKTSNDGTIIELANGKKVPVKREKNGKMRHPADSCAWKEFDERHYDFSKDPRNVRLGLSSDGFNPFGPKGLGNDIDVFLEPLIDELEILWKVGVETYDASRCETFTLHAALIYTIDDFPAYGNLSGWPTKGKRACPYCNVDTCSIYLKGSKKSKDTTLSRLDLVHLNIRKNLHPKEVSGKTYLPPANFTLSKKEKEEMLAVLASVRVPNGYAANIKRRFVDGKLSGLKSHDHPFFDIMVHLVIHLPYEEKILGLVFQRWMYPIERYLQTLQSYVRNKSCPEASIANGALAVECLGFCARYMQDVETKENRPSKENEGNGNDVHIGLSIFSLKCRAMSKKKNYKPGYYVIEQAHNYVLANCETIQVYAREYYKALCEQYNNNYEIIDDMYKRNFSKWFANSVSMHVSSDTCVADDLKYLSCFPSMWVNTMTKFTCNGYRWRVKKIDKGCVTQNSGVVVNADTNAGNVAYFGVLTEILE
ncbi:uncharacterized protein LOC110686459 [Chenopodium quinoa]|uniref:uncharacterized protein LOC110686459 n=1 Tax=Chenopodium quinoa TaxID=63459 RepID=UPI000B795F8B|nr:uncharacterized protein LOC110686459 [Chenopodium quinoa]